jgi:2'-5' RNA ligase
MLYVLSYPVLAPADAERIEAFRRIHEPKRAVLVRAHITLVFGVRSINVEDLASQVATLAGSTVPFAVTFDHAEQTESPGGLHNVFLLANEGAGKLESIHRELNTDSLSSKLLPNLPFRAHMTVATSDSPDRARVAMKETSGIGLPIRGSVDALDVVALKDGQICDVVKFRLNGSVRP